MGEVTRYDSRTVRIITFIAMIYLPINLVSVSLKRGVASASLDRADGMDSQAFFSTTIMQVASSIGDSPRAELKKEVGWFVGITIGLTALTVVGAYYWQRKDELSKSPRNRSMV